MQSHGRLGSALIGVKELTSVQLERSKIWNCSYNRLVNLKQSRVKEPSFLRVCSENISSQNVQDSPFTPSQTLTSSQKQFNTGSSSGSHGDRGKLEMTPARKESENSKFEASQSASKLESSEPGMTGPPSCPVPDFSTTASRLTLLQPLRGSGGIAASKIAVDEITKPLLVYLPGMDGTGQVIRPQIPFLYEQGYDIRCLYIPSSDRSSWKQLVADFLPLLTAEATLELPDSPPGRKEKYRSVTLLAESFGCCLALRVAAAAPEIVSRLVLVNPATGFSRNNILGSLAARTGLLAFFPPDLYQIAQDILLPLLVKRNRVTSVAAGDMLSPVDYVPAPCAAWRLALLNDDRGLEDEVIADISTPTLLISGAKDRVLPSLVETTRLQSLLKNSMRTVLPESGHTIFLEDGVNIAAIMEGNLFPPPPPIRSLAEEDKAPPAGTGLTRNTRDAELDAKLEELGRILEPWRILTSPLVSGDDKLPSRATQGGRGILFVGNHTLFGLYDAPILVHELYLRGFRCRGLAHPAHWYTGVGSLMERYGNIKATPRAAYKLLKEGEHVLLFPGGAREVCKRKGEEYQLMWKKKTDFVRMASKLGALIVPFGALGGDDAYKVVYDVNDILQSPVGPFLETAYSQNGLSVEDSVYPITAIPGTNIPSPLPIPSVERIYFHFSEPIDTSKYGCNVNDPEECQDLYDLVRTRVELSIEHLKSVRDRDPERDLPTRLVRKAMRLLPEFSPRDIK